MIYLILFIVVLAILVLPRWWIAHVIKQHNQPRDDIKGSGAEFARHLLNRLDLEVGVEATPTGDHYDPEAKMVRLSEAHFHQHSLAAIVIAAHEVGHAIQDAKGERLFRRSIKLSKLAILVAKIAPLALTVSPILLALTKSPLISLLTLCLGVLAVGMSTLVSLLNLPVEFDASYNKALPMLKEGQYLGAFDTHQKDYQSAETLLRAAALTYVAGSLYNLLNLAYWLRLLRR